MPYQFLDRRVTRRILVGLLAVGAACLTLTVVFFVSRGSNEADPKRSGPPESPVTRSPTANVGATSVDVAGVRLPVSPTHGPRDLRNGLASGFSRSEAGAALAALHILMRTSPTAGSSVFEPTLTDHVTGSNMPALKLQVGQQYQRLLAQSGTTEGAPIPSGDAEVAGYRLAAYNADKGSASVEVILSSPDLAKTQRLVRIAVGVRWLNGDWRALAPPRGDWGSVSTALGGRPAGLLDYARIG